MGARNVGRPKKSDTFDDSTIEAMQPEAARREVKVPSLPGLRVVVQPSGAKSFVVRYSHGGQYRKLTLGAWPQLRFEPDAVRLYREAMTKKATGADPALELAERIKADVAKREQPTEDASKFTFKTQFEKFLNKPKKGGGFKRASSRVRFLGIIKPVAAEWDARDVRKIAKADCEDVLNAATKRGQHAAASLFMLLNGFFTWLEKREIIVRSPMKSFDRIAAESNCDRVLTDDELKSVWLACDQLGAFGALVRTLMLTGQRRSEVASMQFSEVNGDEWSLPGDKTKNGQPHVVYLADAAKAIINGAPRFAGCDFVFSTDGKTHVSGFSKGKIALDKLAPTSTPWTLHDLRRTFSTRAAMSRVPQVVVEKILNHQKSDVLTPVGKIYNVHAYADERRAAMKEWAATLARIVDGTPSNVVPIRA